MKQIRQLKAAVRCITKPEEVSDAPIHIQVEPVRGCNLNCIICDRPDKVTVMPEPLFKKIIDQIKPLNLTLSGYGEPLLTPTIFDMISYAKKNGAAINLTSNAILLNPNNARKIIESKLDVLSVSIDAASSNTYNIIRKSEKFDNVISNIKTVIGLKKELGSSTPDIRAHFVINKANIDEMNAFVLLMKDIGVTTIYFQPLVIKKNNPNVQILAEGLTKDKMRQALTDAEGCAEQNGISTNISFIMSKFENYWSNYEARPLSPHRYCLQPWFSCYIDCEGNVLICCTINDEGIIGNINDTDFKTIWNNEKYKRTRRCFGQKNLFYETCKLCVPLENISDIMRGRLKFLTKVFTSKRK